MAKFIHNWKELSEVPDSDNYKLEITPKNGNGWVLCKETGKSIHYLSTHTFYGRNHDCSTKKLQSYGFDVVLDNWDKGE